MGFSYRWSSFGGASEGEGERNDVTAIARTLLCNLVVNGESTHACCQPMSVIYYYWFIVGVCNGVFSLHHVCLLSYHL